MSGEKYFTFHNVGSCESHEPCTEAFERDMMLYRLDAVERSLERAIAEIQSLRAAAYSAAKLVSDDRVVRRFARTAQVQSHQPALFTNGGSVKGIRSKIKEVLRQRKEPMTSAQIAEALYQFDPRLSFDLFKRRVIVAASSMHKDGPTPEIRPSSIRGNGREVYWELADVEQDPLPMPSYDVDVGVSYLESPPTQRAS